MESILDNTGEAAEDILLEKCIEPNPYPDGVCNPGPLYCVSQ